jgi:hypothetical protein
MEAAESRLEFGEEEKIFRFRTLQASLFYLK